MKNKWVRKGDKVIVISGNDKGKIGEIIARKGDRVLVRGVNVRRCRINAREKGRKMEYVDREMSIHISNVSCCDDAGTRLRLRRRRAEDGSQALVYLNGGEEISYRVLKKPSTKTSG